MLTQMLSAPLLLAALHAAPPPPPSAYQALLRLAGEDGDTVRLSEAGGLFVPSTGQFAVCGPQVGAITFFDPRFRTRPDLLGSSVRSKIVAISVAAQKPVVAALGGGKVILWDVKGGMSSAGEPRALGGLLSIAISPDANWLACSGIAGDIRVIDVPRSPSLDFEGNTPRGDVVQRTIHRNKSPIHSLLYSPDGGVLIAGCDDGACLVFDAKTDKLVATLKAHAAAIYCCAFSPAKPLLALGGSDDRVTLWDTRTWAKVGEYRHRRSVTALAFHPRGAQLASAGFDRVLVLWDVAESKVQRRIAAGAYINSLGYHPASHDIVSVGERIRFWDSVTGKELDRIGPPKKK